MKTAALLAGIVCLLLTFAGGICVILSRGEADAGYAVVPSLWSVICFGYYRNSARK